ncbi:hypothetical protein FJTKL_15622 [Diaporthe vaccinii]|uniref:Uncharacterized protein n=1 Tax=Diaporthe vaccinii TaxID=105482 RepID=A0ABR4F7S2_9PEZI
MFVNWPVAKSGGDTFTRLFSFGSPQHNSITVCLFVCVFVHSFNVLSCELWESWKRPALWTNLLPPNLLSEFMGHSIITDRFTPHITYFLARSPYCGRESYSLGGVVAVGHDKILGPVVELAGQVGLQDGLCAVGITLLSIERGTGHVRDHGVAASEGVLGVAQRMVLRRGLREPDVTTVAAELAGLEGIGDVLLDDDSSTGGAAGLLVQWAVDGDNITLCQHLLEVLDATGANLLLLLRAQRLVIVVKQLLAVEGLEAAQDTLTDTANGDGTNDLALEIKLVLGSLGDIPVSTLNLLMGGHKVADEGQDGHDDMLGNGDDVGARDLGNSNATVGGVGSVQVNMVGADTSGDSELQVLRLSETLGGQVARVEAVGWGSVLGLITASQMGRMMTAMARR